MGAGQVTSRIAAVGLAIAAGGSIYVVACKLLRVGELDEFASLVVRRLRR